MKHAVKPSEPTEVLWREVQHLRACMRDLVAFDGLRALWTTREPTAVVESLAEALVSTLDADLVYVLLSLRSPSREIRTLRTAAGALPDDRAERVEQTLIPLLRSNSDLASLRVPDLLGPGTLFLTTVRVGEHGFLAAGSAEERFPNDFQRALLNIGTSHLAVLLKDREFFERRAEFALRESEGRFRAVFDGALDAMLIADDEGTYVEGNPAAFALLGRGHDDLLGRRIKDISAPDLDYDRAWRDFQRQGLSAGEWRFVRPDGTLREVEYTATARFLPGLHLAVVRDITERKAAEHALRQAQERTESVLSVADAHHILFDRQWRYLYVNEAAVRAIGKSREEILGHTLWEIYPDVVGTELERQYRRGMDERAPVAFDFHYLTRDTWWHNRFYPAPEGLAVFANDITDRKKAENEIRLSRDRLTELSRRLVEAHETERRTIARELHDEIGQILTGLSLTLETEKRPGARVDRRRAKELVDQLGERVRDLSLNLRPPMLDDLGLIPTLLWHLKHYGEQTGVRVRFHHRGIDSRLPAETEITAFRIVQEALTNVARHAGVKEATVEVWVEDRSLGLRVEDSGRGFAQETRTDHSFGVRGMRERAQLVGGSLTIDSQPGIGTCLLARLPLRPL